MIERLISDNPAFHEYKGVPTSWSVHPETLRFLYALLKPGMTTLETGCGQTTVVFSIAGTQHTCITPSEAEMSRIRDYCRRLNLAENIRFIQESSDAALPCGKDIPEKLDMVFIDGAHRFPIPIIDWYYTASRLKNGSIVAVDDYKMPSVQILFDFLSMEAEWKQVKISENTAFFEKLEDPFIDFEDDWQHQKINLDFKNRTFHGNPEPRPVRADPLRWVKKILIKLKVR
jgi:hypothetical protein